MSRAEATTRLVSVEFARIIHAGTHHQCALPPRKNSSSDSGTRSIVRDPATGKPLGVRAEDPPYGIWPGVGRTQATSKDDIPCRS